MKKIEKINETKSSYFEKINKLDKPLARLIKTNRAQISKIRNKKLQWGEMGWEGDSKGRGHKAIFLKKSYNGHGCCC